MRPFTFPCVFRWLLALHLLVTTPVVTASCPGFELGKTSCSSGIFSSSSIQASCSEDGEVAITGTLTAPSDFDENAEVTFVPCIRSTWICFDEYTQNGGAVCDLISNSDGADCGSAGQYSIEEEFDVPEQAIDHSWTMRFMTIKVLIDHQEACTQNATSSSSSASFMATGMVSLFAFGGLGMYFGRKRRRPLLVLEGDAQGGKNIEHYVQMGDLSPSVSSLGIHGAYSNAAFAY